MSRTAVSQALITGGAGFIGSHLCEALLHRGHAVHVLDDLSTGRLENIGDFASDPGFELTVDSVLSETVLDRLVRQCDVVYHLAAAVGVKLIVEDPVRVVETNVLGTQAVLKAALRHQKGVLITSTSEIYGKSEAMPLREDADRLLGPTTNARWSYSTSKAVDEYLGLAYNHQMGLPVVIARLFNSIGARQTGRYGMVVPRLVAQALGGESLTVYGNGRQSRTFCDVADTVGALIALMAHPQAAGGIFNVGSTRETEILELARMILSIVEPNQTPTESGLADRIVLVPYHEAYAKGFEDMRRRVPDVTRIRELVGWEANIPLEDTLRTIVESHRIASPRSS